MICPYNRKQEKQVLQVTNEYDEDGKADNTQQITSWTYTMMECPQEGVRRLERRALPLCGGQPGELLMKAPERVLFSYHFGPPVPDQQGRQ